MSFLKTLGHDLQIVGKDVLAVAPIGISVLGVVNPAAGVLASGIYGKIMSSMTAVEQTITDASQGALKAATVKADWDNALSIVSEIEGKNYTYDPAKFQAFLDAQTSALNLMSEFKATIKAQ